MVYGPGILMIEAARWLARRRLLAVWRQPTWIHVIATADYPTAPPPPAPVRGEPVEPRRPTRAVPRPPTVPRRRAPTHPPGVPRRGLRRLVRPPTSGEPPSG
jgi:hypothetical protein